MQLDHRFDSRVNKDSQIRGGCLGGLIFSGLATGCCFVRQLLASAPYLAPFGAPFFFRVLLLVSIFFAVLASGYAEELVVRTPLQGDFAAAHEALVESIEAEGLVVGTVLPFNQMLERTADALDKSASPFVNAEIVQFCSSVLAWELVAEDPAQIALCPLSIAIYVEAGEPKKVTMAYRSPGRGSPGKAKADDLLRRLGLRAANLTRLRW